MKLFLRIILVSVFAAFLAGNSMAAPFTFGDDGKALQAVLDGITVDPTTGSSVNVTTDGLSDTMDSYWAIGGTGTSVSTIVIELAGFAGSNTFGIYDSTDSSKKVELFAGGAAAGSKVSVSILGTGEVALGDDPVAGGTGVFFNGNNFGYYLDSTATSASGGGLFFSDTALNTDDLDHMVAYQGKGTDTVEIPPFSEGVWGLSEYVLAFEDLTKSWVDGDGKTHYADRDYTDFVVMVESVTPDPIPEPATMFLLGLGLVGFAGIARKKTV